jgi:hypothetical protein
MRPLALVVAIVAVLAPACAGDGGAPPVAQQTPDLSGPLTALPDCEPPPKGTGEQVKGLMAPEGIVITDVTTQKPLTNVSAYIEQTPIQFEAGYSKRGEISILSSENEIFEAEMLISNGKYRNFLKAVAMCKQGSQLLIVVAPEIAAKGLPKPAGKATASPIPAPRQATAPPPGG